MPKKQKTPPADYVQLRRFLTDRLQRDFTTFRGHETHRQNVRQLLHRAANLGESNSALIVGPRGCGKTTLVSAVLADLIQDPDFLQNTLLVQLDGSFHTDDRLAIKSLTVQLKLENAVDGKVFGSFAENLTFLLECLRAGDKESQSVILIIEEFDLFCTHRNQTLLYNFFDVAQSKEAPICVLGLTCRLDVVELLEKRVKSRFSHRQIFLFPQPNAFKPYMATFQELLSIPRDEEMQTLAQRVHTLQASLTSRDITFHCNHFDPSKYKFGKRFTEVWNRQIAALAADQTVVDAMSNCYDFDVSPAFLKVFLYRLVMQLQCEDSLPAEDGDGVDVTASKCFTANQVVRLSASYDVDDKVEMLCGLSVLELCLVIAIKHHSEIYDRDPFNFEIIYGRFMKFAKVSPSMQGLERSVALKAFERLANTELILPVSTAASKVQKEFEMYKMALTFYQVAGAVQKYQALPTEVSQWSTSSLI